jgi:UDP-N-acetyl-D-mannosaminuronic acid transferase (WecB/TagA/CpsF family)
MIVAAQNDPEFLAALQSADLAIPDGIGIIWALRLLETKLDDRRLKIEDSGGRLKVEGRKNKNDQSIFNPLSSTTILHPPSSIVSAKYQRLSGLSLMESLILQPQKVPPFEPKVMLVGGKPGVAAKAAKILSENSEYSDSRNVRHPDNQKTRNSGFPALRHSDFFGSPSFPSVLKIKAISGPEDITQASKAELDEVVNLINRFRPDLLFVAFGHGKQEKWLRATRHRLRAGVAMGVGGAFDQIADPSLRPPPYINSIGLGWLYRLLRQPWRWRRQLALIRFVWMVLLKKSFLIQQKTQNTQIAGKSDSQKIR